MVEGRKQLGYDFALIPPVRENHDSFDIHSVVPDAPQHHFGGAVLIRDRQHTGGEQVARSRVCGAT